MIKRVERYIESAKQEAKMLLSIQNYSLNEARISENRKYIVRIIEYFSSENSVMLVFEKLGHSLYDILNKNNFKGMDL